MKKHRKNYIAEEKAAIPTTTEQERRRHRRSISLPSRDDPKLS